ncbi:linker for activation of T-cells family member 2 isoform X6 [Dipodomys merriami]|uniref:linker for activation of T-cells family member 2 isoform X6 n=1 Tax=Dipodomys merriami TaxID=94247 RepID=UPI003855E1A8
MKVGPQVNMSGDTELLWLAAVLLLLLGATTGLCACCFHPGVKRAEKIYQQRNVGQAGVYRAPERSGSPQLQPTPHTPHRKNKLQLSCYEAREPGADFCHPILQEVNGSLMPPTFGSSDGNSSDGNSYENVLIFQPRSPGPGELSIGTQAGEGPGGRLSPLCPTDEEESDYQNSTSIYQWHESARTLGQVLGAVCRIPAGSPDNDEPDYVNA